MTTLILSGVGGSTNWLPLIAPLAAIALIFFGIDRTIRFVKRRRHGHHDPALHDGTLEGQSDGLSSDHA